MIRMISNEYSEAITETLDILKHTRNEDVMKISSKFIDFLNQNASKTYKPELDYTKEIKDMNLKHTTKVILAIIYKKFWCPTSQLKEFENRIKQNEIVYQAKLSEQYNPNNLFNNKKIKVGSYTNENLAMIELKETMFTKIKKMLKKFL